jgi:hypothetical protein
LRVADRLRLNSHVFIWRREKSPRLGTEVRRRIASADLVFVGVGSAWEAAIKMALGRLKLPDSFEAGIMDLRLAADGERAGAPEGAAKWVMWGCGAAGVAPGGAAALAGGPRSGQIVCR